MQKRIGLDFDGVLHQYTMGWTGPVPEEPPMDGSLDFVQRLLDRKYELAIISSRAATPEGKEGIENWLKQHQFPDIEVTDKKLPCKIYIDDNGYRFDGDFDPIIRFLDSEI